MAMPAAQRRVSKVCSPVHDLKVWLGSVKLDNAFPTPEALQQLLYGSESSSAEDADVIGLFLTDLLLNNENVDSLRHMLKKALRSPEDYIVNESDRALLIRYIPAQLVKSGEHGGRYMAMSVAVHRRNVGLSDKSATADNFDCFPTPVMLTCKSPRKNVMEPSFKGILAQFVELRRDLRELDLLLLGANLDTQHESKLAQLEALERFVGIRKRDTPFCALMWGDFNSRLVAFEELGPFMAEHTMGRAHLLDSGVGFLVDMLREPEGRRKLLQKDALVFAGRDVNGRHCASSKCNEKMRELFSLHIDAQHLEVPLPSYKRTPLDHLLSERLGCRLRLEDVAVADKLHTNSASLEHTLSSLVDRYFGWRHNGKYLQRAIKSDSADDGTSDNAYLQLGWPDGVGIFRGNTVPAELLAWEADSSILAFDHLPMRSVVSVKWEDAGCDLKVWLGFMKLGFKFPTQRALRQLLYGSPSSSAEGADVVALCLTDLLIHNDNVDSLRHMLKKALKSPEDYMLNEEDRNLLIQHIPAQLVKAGDNGGRYVSMSIAVHRRNLRHCGGTEEESVFDCFRVPVQLTCKSPRKNELEPSFKAVLEQDLVLSRGCRQMNLVLLGANLDAQDEPKMRQMEAVHRLLRARVRSDPFCALIWGSLNNRVVACEELQPHVHQPRPGEFELTDSGVELLAEMIADPAERRKLLLKDALVYSGRDVSGRQFIASRCSVLTSQIFALHLEAAERLEVPLPFYKHTPLDYLLSERLGCRLRLEDVTLAEQLQGATLEHTLSDLQGRYFGWKQGGKHLQRVVKPDLSDDGAAELAYLQLGWLDGIGVYRGSSAHAELRAWETEDRILAFDHLPLRSLVQVSF